MSASRELGSRGAPGGCDAAAGGTTAQQRILPGSRVRKAKSALVLGDYGLPHHAIARSGALFAMQDTLWDHGLTVTDDAEGLAGHAGGVILQEMADRSGLTTALKDALARDGRFPGRDRGVAMVPAAVMIALGGTSMSGIAVLGHLSRVLGEPVTWQTLRRTLNLAGPGTMEKIAQARVRAGPACQTALGPCSSNGAEAERGSGSDPSARRPHTCGHSNRLYASCFVWIDPRVPAREAT
jgi:hypothetical protein